MLLMVISSLSLSPTVGALSEVFQLTDRTFRLERDFDRLSRLVFSVYSICMSQLEDMTHPSILHMDVFMQREHGRGSCPLSPTVGPLR